MRKDYYISKGAITVTSRKLHYVKTEFNNLLET